MADKRHAKTNSGSFLKTLWEAGTDFAKGARPLLRNFGNKFDERLNVYAKAVEKRLIFLTLGAFTLFTSALFLVLGVVFILIDYCSVPRGVVFLCGGLLGMIVFMFFAQMIKN